MQPIHYQKNIYFMNLRQRNLTCAGLVLAIALLLMGSPTIAWAQAPIVLEASGTSALLELPLDSTISQQLESGASVQLATAAQHQAYGLPYPDWLADAAFSIKKRPLQRRAILITTKRSNPALTADVLLVFAQAGRKTYHPLTLFFEQPIPSFSSGTARTQPQTEDIASASPPALSSPTSAEVPRLLVTARPGAAPTPTPTSTPTASPKQPRARAARQTPPPPALAPSEPTPTPAATAQPPLAPASAAIAAPSIAPAPLPTRPPVLAPAPTASTLDSAELIIGLGLLAALGYLIYRMIKKRRNLHRDKKSRLDPHTTNAGANTVFGMSDEAAHAMHAKWLRQQALGTSVEPHGIETK